MATREDVRNEPAREDVRGGVTGKRTVRGADRAQRSRVGRREAEAPIARFTEREAQPNGAHGDKRLANGLGWFSVGLGLAQVLSPGGVARLIGVADDSRNRSLMRALGLREIATGVGILAKPRPAGWVRARVGGDLMDLALLGAALRSDGSEKGRVAMATAAVLGVTALDVVCSERLSGKSDRTAAADAPGKVHVTKAVTIKRSPEEVYGFWRNFENLPRFMYHLEDVQVRDSGRSHWRAKAPAGMTVEWDAEVVDDRPGERISWRSVADADVANAGTVEFRPASRGRGTEVLVEMRYDPPGGKVGVLVAKLFGEEPSQQIGDDLRRLKQVMEIGEVMRSEASPEGQGRTYAAQRPAKALEGGEARL